MQLLQKQVSRHEFTMAGSLCQVSRNDDGRWSELREIRRQPLELIQIRVRAKMQVRDVREDCFRHQITRTR